MQKVNAGIGTGQSKKSQLLSAAIVLASVLMLFLTSCTKQEIHILKEHLPGGVGSTPKNWYYFKANYQTQKGATATGYFYPVGYNAVTPYYTELIMKSDTFSATKFKIYPATEVGDGWQYWATNDGLWLSLSYDGFLYRSSDTTAGNRVAWKIVDGKLYNSYDRWKDYPAGARYYGSNPFTVFGYYAGVDFGDQYVFANCTLVPQ